MTLLTDKTCKNAKPKEKPYKISDSKGLHLLIHNNASKYWRYKYRFNGAEKTLALGVYPEVTLAEAREKCLEARKTLASGIDPNFAKKQKKQLSLLDTKNTFQIIAKEWHENKKSSWTEAYGRTILRDLEKDIFPELGSLSIKEIKPLQFLQVIRKIENRGAPEIARRIASCCAEVFHLAIITGRAEYNPANDIKKALKPRKHGHHACIDIKELPDLILSIENNNARLFPQTRLATKLIMLTFVRTGELIKATWSEFDFENNEWIIPASRMKMKKDHKVPLSRQAIEILHELKKLSGKSEWILPSVHGHLKHISNGTILKALSRMGFKGKMTGHGFRSLAMTAIMERLHYRFEVPDRQLAHTHGNKVAAAYDRSQFWDERKKMMQEWADYIDAVAINKTSSSN